MASLDTLLKTMRLEREAGGGRQWEWLAGKDGLIFCLSARWSLLLHPLLLLCVCVHVGVYMQGNGARSSQDVWPGVCTAACELEIPTVSTSRTVFSLQQGCSVKLIKLISASLFWAWKGRDGWIWGPSLSLCASIFNKQSKINYRSCDVCHESMLLLFGIITAQWNGLTLNYVVKI